MRCPTRHRSWQRPRPRAPSRLDCSFFFWGSAPLVASPEIWQGRRVHYVDSYDQTHILRHCDTGLYEHIFPDSTFDIPRIRRCHPEFDIRSGSRKTHHAHADFTALRFCDLVDSLLHPRASPRSVFHFGAISPISSIGTYLSVLYSMLSSPFSVQLFSVTFLSLFISSPDLLINHCYISPSYWAERGDGSLGFGLEGRWVPVQLVGWMRSYVLSGESEGLTAFLVSQCHIDLDIGGAFCFLLFTLGFIARDNWDNYRALG